MRTVHLRKRHFRISNFHSFTKPKVDDLSFVIASEVFEGFFRARTSEDRAPGVVCS